ncbi:MAG: hypothetical protein ACK5HO_03895 [Pseudomonadota bacterium]
MEPTTASDDNGAFSVQKSIFGPECIAIRFKPRKSIFEFAPRARKITILGALAWQGFFWTSLEVVVLIRIRESIAFSKTRDFATDFWRTL